jgi:hypothetical protein
MQLRGRVKLHLTAHSGIDPFPFPIVKSLSLTYFYVNTYRNPSWIPARRITVKDGELAHLAISISIDSYLPSQ